MWLVYQASISSIVGKYGLLIGSQPGRVLKYPHTPLHGLVLSSTLPEASNVFSYLYTFVSMFPLLSLLFIVGSRRGK